MKGGNHRNTYYIVVIIDKVYSRLKEIRRVVAWLGGGGVLTAKRHEGTFRSVGNILYLDWGSSYTDV